MGVGESAILPISAISNHITAVCAYLSARYVTHNFAPGWTSIHESCMYVTERNGGDHQQ
jgi:hypothetical protein